uniref:N-acetyltransferase domain-containing protein n=2 Tax=Dendroctonus ponderosae TaxID=77166 RepID=J3JTI2_DENPD|nr:unknown [Dendroctonus ponderosae]
MHKESTMHLIVIRKQRDNDTPQVSELVRNAYASNISNMFLGYVFNEVTFQITMIFIALEFIFFQIRLFVCFLTVPLILLLIYVCIYGAVTMKSAQVMYEKKPIISWVAEVYEPFFQATDQKSRYKIIDDQQLEDMKEKPQGRKQIIGTVAVMRHFQNPDWAWLFRVVTDER